MARTRDPSERRWMELFSRPESEDLLERMADAAIAEHEAGRTRPLDMEEAQPKDDPPDYSVAGESPLGSCHRGGTFDETISGDGA